MTRKTVAGIALTVALAVATWEGLMPANMATGLVFGGAIANLADRALGGSVVDMFAIGWWPAFNLADVCIVIGVAGLLSQSVHPGGRPIPESAS